MDYKITLTPIKEAIKQEIIQLKRIREEYAKQWNVYVKPPDIKSYDTREEALKKISKRYDLIIKKESQLDNEKMKMLEKIDNYIKFFRSMNLKTYEKALNKVKAENGDLDNEIWAAGEKSSKPDLTPNP